MGWETIAGFQTRNPIHNAHEHLQRLALDLCDALFINPIVGWKKIGDFTEEAVLVAYRKMIDEFYPQDRIYFAGLKTQMRYAGPREAIFHAIIRKNLGCTHFIIGRDHAGVGGYYGPYDAHVLAKELMEKYDLGINLLLFNEPYYCTKCGFVVSNKTCAHEKTHRVEISGTRIRKCMNDGEIPESILMRPEISKELLKLKTIFIEE
jgi:sulfate adenylyltransferase